MDEEYHGYYLHCQSPFEFSDFSFEELENQMGRENAGYLMNRGLSAPGAPPDCQTFEFFASDLFRSHFKKVSKQLTTTRLANIPAHNESDNPNCNFMTALIHLKASHIIYIDVKKRDKIRSKQGWFDRKIFLNEGRALEIPLQLYWTVSFAQPWWLTPCG